MSDIGNLIIKIGADAGELEKAFVKLGGSAQQFQRGLETIGKIASTAFLAAAASATAMAVAAGKQAEQMEQLSVVTGINTDKLQEYDVMLNRAGLSGDDLALSMKKLSVGLEAARQGTGTTGDHFRQLGIDIRTVTSTDDLIQKITQSASRFADGLGKDAIMADLLGRSWQTFLKAFGGGKKAFDDAAESSKRLGLTMSGDNLRALTKMDDAIDDMNKSWQRFGQQLGVLIAPSLTMIVQKMQELLAWGSRAFHELSLQLDIFSTKLLHMALKANEVLGTLFSQNIFNGDAWKQVMSNIEFIDKEADKQIAKLTAAHALVRQAAPDDSRPAAPQFVNAEKESAFLIKQLDLQLKAKEQQETNYLSLGKAQLANRMAELDAEKAYGLRTDIDIERSRMSAIEQEQLLNQDSLNRQYADYNTYVIKKRQLFTDDEKGRKEALNFELEANQKQLEFASKIGIAHVEASTAMIQAGLQVKTFWTEQLQAIVASNAFSTGQIISTWTNGVANSIVNGGDFVKAAWKSTEIAVIQGIMNISVQWAAKQALALTQSTAVQTAITEFFGVQETARAAIMTTSGKAAALATSVALAGVTTVGTAALGVLTTVLEGVVSFMLAIAAAVAEVPLIGQALAGTLIVGATLAQVLGTAAIASATAALAAASVAAAGTAKFSQGGIGRFGEGTPAMLHGTEAVIPLDSRGASFMQEAFGGKGGVPIHTHVYLNGREIAQAVSDETPGAWRTMGVI